MIGRAGAFDLALACRRRLAGPYRLRRPFSAARERTAVTAAFWLVRAFYLFLFYVAFDLLRQLDELGRSGRVADWLWPVAWAEPLGFARAGVLTGSALLIGCAVLLYRPGSVVARAAVALTFLGCIALENSFGSINHYAHLALWLAIAFALLPGGTLEELLAADRRVARRRFLATFFFAQALAGLFYTLSGLHKVYFGLFVPVGRVGSFAPDALPLLVAHRWLQTGEAPLLQQLFLAHGWIAWPGYLLVIYLETVAFVAVFRPELHRLWGTGLMIFHLLVWAVMGITFRYQPMLVAMLFVLSPFDPSGVGLGARLAQLPLLGGLARAAARHAAGARQPSA